MSTICETDLKVILELKDYAYFIQTWLSSTTPPVAKFRRSVSCKQKYQFSSGSEQSWHTSLISILQPIPSGCGYSWKSRNNSKFCWATINQASDHTPAHFSRNELEGSPWAFIITGASSRRPVKRLAQQNIYIKIIILVTSLSDCLSLRWPVIFVSRKTKFALAYQR